MIGVFEITGVEFKDVEILANVNYVGPDFTAQANPFALVYNRPNLDSAQNIENDLMVAIARHDALVASRGLEGLAVGTKVNDVQDLFTKAYLEGRKNIQDPYLKRQLPSFRM